MPGEASEIQRNRAARAASRLSAGAADNAVAIVDDDNFMFSFGVGAFEGSGSDNEYRSVTVN